MSEGFYYDSFIPVLTLAIQILKMDAEQIPRGQVSEVNDRAKPDDIDAVAMCITTRINDVLIVDLD